VTGDPSFDDLSDAEKVTFSEDEVAATLSKLDELIAQLSALRTEVEDPDGLVRISLGDDGRLLALFIDDAVGTSLTNLALESKINALLAAGNEAVWQTRQQWRDSMREFGSGE
jgi:DNA-binding protein YbaB